MDIHNILRAQYIKRWTIVHTIHQQSVAEHTFNMTMIARAICKEAGIPDEMVIKACLEHDLDEIITGDIPTPAKKLAIDKGIDLRFLHNGAKIRDMPYNEMAIVAMADLIEAAWFISENAVGRHPKWVEDIIVESLEKQKRGLPRVIWDAVHKVIDMMADGEFE